MRRRLKDAGPKCSSGRQCHPPAYGDEVHRVASPWTPCCRGRRPADADVEQEPDYGDVLANFLSDGRVPYRQAVQTLARYAV
jgi:hypothetical protein